MSILQNGTIEVWTKSLPPLSEYAAVILNRGTHGAPTNVSIVVRDFGVKYDIGVFDIQDVFLNKDYYNYDLDQVFSIEINPNSVAFLHFYPSE